ncbi:hypothetical protein [Microbacterium sp. NIBRBAC000506063]|uniref:hypothetical protein n=1 Tax=Microbacterium sp. NIBRBAC000506063 TaxID=2734618 RepID=UPI00397FE90D
MTTATVARAIVNTQVTLSPSEKAAPGLVVWYSCRKLPTPERPPAKEAGSR